MEKRGNQSNTPEKNWGGIPLWLYNNRTGERKTQYQKTLFMAKADTKPTKAKPPRSPQLIVAVVIALLIFIATASLLNAQNRLLREQQTVTPTPTSQPTPKPTRTPTPKPTAKAQRFPEFVKPQQPESVINPTQAIATPTATSRIVDCPLAKDGQNKIELTDCYKLIEEYNSNLKKRQEEVLKKNQEILAENARLLAQYEADMVAYEAERQRLLTECLNWAESLVVESSFDPKNFSLAFPDARVMLPENNETQRLRQSQIEQCHAYYGD